MFCLKKCLKYSIRILDPTKAARPRGLMIWFVQNVTGHRR